MRVSAVIAELRAFVVRRGVHINHETYGSAKQVRAAVRGQGATESGEPNASHRHWRWHLDEVYVRLNGELMYLWRVVDYEGEVLVSHLMRTRNKDVALQFTKKVLKHRGSPEAITTDGLCSCGAARSESSCREKQEVRRWTNNRTENSHLPFRQGERAMLRLDD